VKPIARPAWRCPREGSGSRPDLLRDPGGGEQAQADRSGEELLRGHILLDPEGELRGRSSGKTKNQRNICTSSGTFRNSSTYTLQRRTSQGRGAVRTVPTTEPITSAMTQALRETLTVHPSPVISQERYVSSRLDLLEVDPQFQW